MNMKNQEFLNKQVFYTGFGTELEQKLDEKLAQQAPAFTLTHQATYGNDEAEATLHFKRSNQSELYFFNNYDLTVKKGNGQDIKQTFYIGKENNITFKEAYNLLCGRAIHKNWTKLEKVGEGEEIRYQPTDEKYDAWMQLDLKNPDEQGNFKAQRYHDNYNFDLEKALAEQPIKGLNSEQDKMQLMDSLKKGNRQAITIVDGDTNRQVFIEANPKDRTLNVYGAKTELKQEENQKTSKQSISEKPAMNEAKKNGRSKKQGAHL